MVCTHVTGEAIQQEVGAMDGTKRRADRMPSVERSFEWSRFGNQLMASAYQQVLPIIRHPPATKPEPLGSSSPDSWIRTERRLATGA